MNALIDSDTTTGDNKNTAQGIDAYFRKIDDTNDDALKK